MSHAAVASSNALTPVQPEERIVILDVLRGFALLGILAVNLPGAASSGYAWAAGLQPFPAWWDRWGFGFYGRFGPAACLALTAVIFTAQAVYSRWWMARFRFGPLEWLWRGAAYGHFPPLRLSRAGAAAAHVN
jgi:uncharacterized membrane protein YeiB